MPLRCTIEGGAVTADDLVSVGLRGWLCTPPEVEPAVEINGSYSFERRKSPRENSSLLGFRLLLLCCLCCCGGVGRWG